MLKKEINAYGFKCLLACDGKCEKAYGWNNRPYIKLSDDEDDKQWLSDNEVDNAPMNTGVYEDGHGKPQNDEEKLNKWCFRECERSETFKLSEEISLLDWSKRINNIVK